MIISAVMKIEKGMLKKLTENHYPLDNVRYYADEYLGFLTFYDYFDFDSAFLITFLGFGEITLDFFGFIFLDVG
jgi:hypothetical protein